MALRSKQLLVTSAISPGWAVSVLASYWCHRIAKVISVEGVSCVRERVPNRTLECVHLLATYHAATVPLFLTRSAALQAATSMLDRHIILGETYAKSGCLFSTLTVAIVPACSGVPNDASWCG